MNYDEQQVMPGQPAGRRVRRVMISVIVVLIVLVGLSGYVYLNLFRPVRLAQPESVTIERLATLNFVAKRLQERHLIPSATAFRLYARFTHRANKLKQGEYEINNGVTPAGILDLLVSGRARVFRLTVPEGKWASEIAKIYMQPHWPAATDEFQQLVDQPEQWQAKVPFPIKGKSLEGYLFPDTYRFPANATARDIIEKMLDRMSTTCWAAYKADPPRDGRSFYDVLILASLVEGEAKKKDERPIIAGVYMNRLHSQGWMLDCDATLIYAKQERVGRLFERDKEIDSPYNSYRRQGLPPGPINNPGLDAFRAALHPAKVDYYFYVARGDGSHIFARTLAEQTANIRRVRGK